MSKKSPRRLFVFRDIKLHYVLVTPGLPFRQRRLLYDCIHLDHACKINLLSATKIQHQGRRRGLAWPDMFQLLERTWELQLINKELKSRDGRC